MRINKQPESFKKVPALLKKIPRVISVVPKNLVKGVLWRVSLKRRAAVRLFRRLKPIENASPEMQKIWEEVFKHITLKIKSPQQREDLYLLLDSCNAPAGPEWIFVISIFPLILRHNLLAYAEPTEPHRLDVEIGYIGHADEYYFWMLEVDGMLTEEANHLPEPRREPREDVIYIAYRIPAAGILNIEQEPNASTLILKSQHYFLNIIKDVKLKGYLVAPAKAHTSDTVFWQRRRKENAYQTKLSQQRRRREKLERELRKSR